MIIPMSNVISLLPTHKIENFLLSMIVVSLLSLPTVIVAHKYHETVVSRNTVGSVTCAKYKSLFHVIMVPKN